MKCFDVRRGDGFIVPGWLVHLCFLQKAEVEKNNRTGVFQIFSAASSGAYHVNWKGDAVR